MTQELSVQLLGQFRLARSDAGADTAPGSPAVTPPAFRSQRLQSILAYLILHRQAPVARAHLAFQLWPVSTEEQALTNLRNQLHHLRLALPDAERYITADARSVQWRADAPAEVDVIAFEDALAGASRQRASGDPEGAIGALRGAAGFYRDDLLPACYDEWIAPERERLRLDFLAALDQLVLLLEAAGKPAEALPFAQRLVRHEPLEEAGYRHLLTLYAATGDRVAALRTYQACTTVLERELAASPSPATQLAFERSQVVAPVVLQPAVPAPAPNRLPTVLTRFIGREDEVTELHRRLEDTRLLTLTGPGGAGKTRLALRLAERQAAAPELDGRVWWVDLAPVTEPGLVGSTWISALGAARAGDTSEAGIIAAHLGPAPALVVVDNCEHVVQDCGTLTEAVLARCPNLTVLATSRERLAVAGEVVWPVRPLRLPERHRRIDADQSRLPDAMALFVDRAAAVMPTFTLTSANSAAIATICRRVDGLPLAIELAAAAVRVMSVRDIAERLATSLDLPPSRSRGGPDRHRTLDAAIDWSYQRLEPPEQALFRQLAIFAGSFSLEAAEAIWHGAPDDHDLLWLLAQLVDKSVVTVGERRARTEYRLLEALRQYGRRALAAAGELDATSRRHADHFVTVVERDHPQVDHAGEARWLSRIEVAEDDIRAALAWSAEQGSAGAETLARLATGMVRYWRIRDRNAEATRWLATVRSQPAGVPPRLRAIALRDAAGFAMAAGDLDLSGSLLEDSLAIWHELGDALGQASTETGLASQALFKGELDRAWQLVSDSLERYRAGADRAGERHCLSVMGAIRRVQGDLLAARELHTRALALGRALGQRWETAGSLYHLAGIALMLHDAAAAEPLCDELYQAFSELGDRTGMTEAKELRARLAMLNGQTDVARPALQELLIVRREMDDTWGMASSLHDLGVLESGAGNLGPASAALREATLLYQEVCDTGTMVECLEDLAHLAAMGGEWYLAVRIYGATAAWRTKAGSVAKADGAEQCAADLAAARQALGDGDFAAAWAEGEGATLDEAVALATQ